MSYMSNKSYIKNFNFPNPNWDNLPVGFPNCDTSGLTKEEICLLDAIKLAWLTGTPAGKRQIASRFVKSCSFVLISLITLITLITLIFPYSEAQLTKPVSAATISATLKQSVQLDIKNIENLIESTMSAIRKAD